MRDVNSSKTELCKFNRNVRMLLNGGDNSVVVQMKKAEVLNTLLLPSSQVKITPRFPDVPGWFERKHFGDKLGMS